MRSPAASFLDTYRGASAPSGDDPELEAALALFIARGRAGWPDVVIDDATLAGYLGERAPAEGSPAAWMGGLHAEDLFLACGCAAGLPEALRAFDATILSKLDLYLRTVRASPELVAETRQVLLEKLFVGGEGRPPKILQYSGQGALAAWVRVAAVRTALNLLEAERAEPPRANEAEQLARAIVPDGDPEIALLRAQYEGELLDALRAAVAGLSRRDRGLLRFTFVEQMTPARLGAMYGVHRTTAMRWIEAAQEEVLARTRARMMERLGLPPSECEAAMMLVKSRLDLRLDSLFRSVS